MTSTLDKAVGVVEYEARAVAIGIEGAVANEMEDYELLYAAVVRDNKTHDSVFDTNQGWQPTPTAREDYERRMMLQNGYVSGSVGGIAYERMSVRNNPKGNSYGRIAAKPKEGYQPVGAHPSKAFVVVDQAPMELPTPAAPAQQSFWASLFGCGGDRSAERAVVQQLAKTKDAIVEATIAEKIPFNVATAPDELQKEMLGTDTDIPFDTFGTAVDTPVEHTGKDHFAIPDSVQSARIPSQKEAEKVNKNAHELPSRALARKLVRVGEQPWDGRFVDSVNVSVTNAQLNEQSKKGDDEASPLPETRKVPQNVEVDKDGRSWIRVK